MSDAVEPPSVLTALLTKRGWVRCDVIVGVYVEDREVKLRCMPGVFSWHPTVSTHDTIEEAIAARDDLADALWTTP
jgi:hypothetical protein